MADADSTTHIQSFEFLNLKKCEAQRKKNAKLREQRTEARLGRDPGSCIICGKPFVKRMPQQKTCSIGCRREKARAYNGQSEVLPIPTATVGAISELAVSANLMAKGYHVFRALSPACPCDLIAIKDGEIRYIEVRTGTRTATGKLLFPTRRHACVTELAIFIRAENEVVIILVDRLDGSLSLPLP